MTIRYFDRVPRFTTKLDFRRAGCRSLDVRHAGAPGSFDDGLLDFPWFSRVDLDMIQDLMDHFRILRKMAVSRFDARDLRTAIPQPEMFSGSPVPWRVR